MGIKNQEEGGYSKVYLASWNDGLYFGTMKVWINEKLVMQYASGGDLLRQYLQDNFVEIDWYQKISILLEIAKGLKAIHNHGYVHRDFHGGNVLLDLSEENEESKYNVTQNMIY
ncbi:5845_t:CDS:2 [Rhizophagus irregularis]|nr:5845_t:CDS:2 [Rhizophagus irregularis]